jgi:hypothetical protein
MKRLPDLSAASAQRPLLALIALVSLFLNLYGNGWGTPDRWHEDEMDVMAAGMLADGTLNPHFFPYGALHYYVLALTAAAPVGAFNYLLDRKPAASDAKALQEWRDRKATRVRILGRATSAVMAALVVLITSAMGELLFGRLAGLVAAAFVAVSPYFVLIAHLATVDAAANFWYWLACLLAVLAWKDRPAPWFALAAFVVGLSSGTKIDHSLAVIPWIAAGLLRRPPLSGARFLGCAALIPVGYVVANPTLLFSFFEFMDGTSQELIFNMLRSEGKSTFASLLADMATGMGLPLLAVCLAGLGYLSYRAVRGSGPRELTWLLTAILPMYLVFVGRYSGLWYSPFFYPGLAIIGAQACVILSRGAPLVRNVIAGVVFAAILWSVLGAFAVDETFKHDSRYAATAWIEEHAPHGATVEVSHRGPVFPEGLYQVQRDELPADYWVGLRGSGEVIEDSPLYSKVHGALVSLRQAYTEVTGRADSGPAYQAWSVRVLATQASKPVVAAGPDPDYRVVVDYVDVTLLRRLLSPDSGYALAATFHYRNPLGMDVKLLTLNPTVYVFRKNGAATR